MNPIFYIEVTQLKNVIVVLCLVLKVRKEAWKQISNAEFIFIFICNCSYRDFFSFTGIIQ
jgi:hypothetical protein